MNQWPFTFHLPIQKTNEPPVSNQAKKLFLKSITQSISQRTANTPIYRTCQIEKPPMSLRPEPRSLVYRSAPINQAYHLRLAHARVQAQIWPETRQKNTDTSHVCAYIVGRCRDGSVALFSSRARELAQSAARDPAVCACVCAVCVCVLHVWTAAHVVLLGQITMMFWSSEPDEEEEALLCSPALMARRASESWIDAPPVEVVDQSSAG